MAHWTNYWRIVKPASRKAAYQSGVNLDDGYDLTTAGYSAHASVSWLANLLKSATSRLQRYKQYDAMDHGDIARALDITAEEITNFDRKTGLPFIIEYQTEQSEDIEDNVIVTLRAALRAWSNLHDFRNRLFAITRCLIKYGDCFFRKRSDTKAWEYIDPTRVIGIEIDPNTNRPIAFHIKETSFKQRLTPTTTDVAAERVPAAAIVHFTLSNDMGDSAPFGKSVLQDAVRDYRRLSMLEDAAIIYRIVRAPERRVFYIDVGNMPAQRVKAYMASIINDIRQKKIPNTTTGTSVDSQYNPETIQEDYFFPVTAAGRGSRVETLATGTTWEMPELEYFMNKVFRALRVPTSYMKGQDAQGAQYNDGKVGIAYIEELRFANYIMRLQAAVEKVVDEQFKLYLQVIGIDVDIDLFRLELPEPQNFALYRQAALDAELINAFKAIEDTKYISKRFMLKRYLGLTDDELQMNEVMLKQERGITQAAGVDELRQVYDPLIYDNREQAQPEPGALGAQPSPSGEGEGSGEESEELDLGAEPPAS
jgi:hypothetical protein